MCIQNMSQHELAAGHLSRSLALDPTCWRMSIRFGNLAARRGDTATALRVFAHVIRTNPLVAQSFYSRGVLQLQQQQFNRSCLSFQRAWALNPLFHTTPEFSSALQGLQSLRSAMSNALPSTRCPIQHLDVAISRVAISRGAEPHSKTRRFSTTYHSSEWEQLWLDNIQHWQNHGICEALAGQQEQVRSFMKDTCTARTDTMWCLVSDSVQMLWYHTVDGRIQVAKPSNILQVSPYDSTCTSVATHCNTLQHTATHCNTPC